MVSSKLVLKIQQKIMSVKEHVLTKYHTSSSKIYCLIPRRIRREYAIIWKYTREKQLEEKGRRVVDTKTDSWAARRKVCWNEDYRGQVYGALSTYNNPPPLLNTIIKTS
jgi:hypothetical protein